MQKISDGCKQFKVRPSAMVWVVVLTVLAVALRLWVVEVRGMTGDLEWYLSPDRPFQATQLGTDKRMVSVIIDFVPTEFKLILMASICVVAIWLIIFLFTREHLARSTRNFRQAAYVAAIGLLLSPYLAQLDVHLWRQQVSLYLATAALLTVKKRLSTSLMALAIFFHEIGLVMLAARLSMAAFLYFSNPPRRLPTALLLAIVLLAVATLKLESDFRFTQLALICLCLIGISAFLGIGGTADRRVIGEAGWTVCIGALLVVVEDGSATSMRALGFVLNFAYLIAVLCLTSWVYRRFRSWGDRSVALTCGLSAYLAYGISSFG